MRSMAQHTLDICDPCRDGTHLECVGDEQRKCQCLVCAGEKIGNEVMGDSGGNMPKHGQIADRYDPRKWRP